MESAPAVRSRSITKYFGDVVALDGVDLDIPRGQVHGLVGPNGAGKTTLLGLLLGLSVPDRGSLEILGAPVDRVLGVPDLVGAARSTMLWSRSVSSTLLATASVAFHSGCASASVWQPPC
jgi:ABC-2 type transport system ATP-binding protein